MVYTLQILFFTLNILLCYNGSLASVWQSQNQYSGCISQQHLASLATSAKNRIKSSIPASVKCVCTSYTSPLEGWDITCFDASFSTMKKQKNGPTEQPIRVNGSKGPLSSIGSSEFDLDDNSPSGRRSVYNLASSSLGFTVKNENGKFVEISCHSAIPDFKPAMFQGKYICNIFTKQKGKI